ncbi:MAG: acetyltransferase [Ruminococcaceae bacterium]|nr:acetyltransferase [Oscillospiraceae bacterium]
MRDLVIIGAGDFGREVSWVVERSNACDAQWNLLGFVDDAPAVQGMVFDGYPVLGTTAWLAQRTEETWVVCSIGTGRVRKQVLERVLQQENLHPATLIDPAAIVARGARVGEGCVVCAGTVLAIHAELAPHVIVNLNCTVGHDTVLEPFCTIHPGTNLSGKVLVGEGCDIGTGTKVIQGVRLCAGCVVGAGAVVTKTIDEPGTYVGVPVRRIR